MMYYYKYIIDKCGQPKWFDEHGVPRYEEMHPDNVSNIYAQVVIFSRIECSACQCPFSVTFSQSVIDRINNRDLVELEKQGNLHWGDPPNIRCCPTGPVTTTNYVDTLEIWTRDKFEWRKI